MQPANWQQATMEFHVSRRSRDHYQFDESLFALSGNVIFANFYAARVFAQKINHKRDLVSFPERAVRAGQINALGLIDEMLHHVMQLYRESALYMERTAPWIERAGLAYVKQHVVEDASERARRYTRFLESQRYSQDDPWKERAEGKDAHEYEPLATIA